MEPMPTQSPDVAAPMFVPVGSNDVLVFGLHAGTRARRLAADAGLERTDSVAPGRANLLADLDFAWDPAWLAEIAGRPASVLMLGKRAVLAHLPAGMDAGPMIAAMHGRAAWTGDGLERLDTATTHVSNHELRKRERPFVMLLDAGSAERVERAAYDASYKGVTDALTLYLWRGLAFHLTRLAARIGISPNMVTSLGALLCLAAFLLFWSGDYWFGMAAGFGFMVLDTVDGKLARCTGQSSRWGNFFDHGIDLIHPPFWWWAWAEGLSANDMAMEPVYEAAIVGAIVAGYVVQRVIEGLFIVKYHMHIHVWRPIDSKFRLITARRNPNMIILFASLIVGRPDVGIELVALWTIMSLIFHAVRLAQANARAERGRKLVSWLA